MEQHMIDVIDVINECATGSHEGTLRFPDVVKKLSEVGVAQYHADFLRAETTYYQHDGVTHIVPLPLPSEAIAADFRSADVAAAVRAAQQEGLPYQKFLSRVMQAGCAGYFVYLDGQRVIYLGRTGDMHIEYFPGST